jgi:hypothetical protein
MRVGCWLPKATAEHREYTIIAFALQQWLSESTSVLRYVVAIIERIPKRGAGMFVSNLLTGSGGWGRGRGGVRVT